MKILYFGGGLGNQIFEYAFFLTIKEKFPQQRILCVFDNKRFKEHAGGFELEQVFNVKLPESSKVGQFLMAIIMSWNRFVRVTNKYCHNLTTPNYNAVVFNAFKMNKDFFIQRRDWIEFSPIALSSQNQSIIDGMLHSNSVVLHVRRGDYLSPKYAKKLAGIASMEYYSKAIAYIRKEITNPIFYVFSDDIVWCKKNLSLDNAIYVDWNKGKNSFLDMYLMTFSKANIIANSTFSFWGAYLNKRNRIVIYPSKWNSITSDGLNIFPENWLGF